MIPALPTSGTRRLTRSELRRISTNFSTHAATVALPATGEENHIFAEPSRMRIAGRLQTELPRPLTVTRQC